MQQSEGVAYSVLDGVGRIHLNRPDRANSLTRAAVRALIRAIDEVLARKPRVVLLSAEGAIFCAGGDIDEFAAAGTALDTLVGDILTPLHPALHRVATAPMPVISAINGPVAGGGIGLALCADFVLGAASMRLRTAYAAVGLSPDVGASYFLARRVGPVRAQQWLMLNETIDAQRCLQHGVLDALYPDAELSDAAHALVTRLACAASESLTAIKTLCAGLPARGLPEQLTLEHALMAACARGADAQEGVRAFVAKGPPRFART